MRDLAGRDYEVGHCRDCGREVRLALHVGQVGAVEYREDGLRVLCSDCALGYWPPPPRLATATPVS